MLSRWNKKKCIYWNTKKERIMLFTYFWDKDYKFLFQRKLKLFFFTENFDKCVFTNKNQLTQICWLKYLAICNNEIWNFYFFFNLKLLLNIRRSYFLNCKKYKKFLYFDNHAIDLMQFIAIKGSNYDILTYSDANASALQYNNISY